MCEVSSVPNSRPRSKPRCVRFADDRLTQRVSNKDAVRVTLVRVVAVSACPGGTLESHTLESMRTQYNRTQCENAIQY